MMDHLPLVEYSAAIGHDILLEGGQLRITNGKHLPADLKEKIVEYKPKIIEALKLDKMARKKGFLIGISGRLYLKDTSRFSTVYIEQKDNKWSVWRETYQNGRRQAISEKSIAIANTLGYALDKAEKYFEYISNFRK